MGVEVEVLGAHATVVPEVPTQRGAVCGASKRGSWLRCEGIVNVGLFTSFV